MSSPGSQVQQWCPPEITSAGVPLNEVSRVLRALSEDRRDVVDLLRSSPFVEVRAAFDDFLHAWMLALFRISGDAHSLATALRDAAQDYEIAEGTLVGGLDRR